MNRLILGITIGFIWGIALSIAGILVLRSIEDGTLNIAHKEVHSIQKITDDIYNKFSGIKRTVFILYSKDKHGIGQIYFTAIAETYFSDVNPILPDFVNVLANIEQPYYLEFLKNKCTKKGANQYAIVSKDKIKLNTYSITCPVFAPHLIGEIAIVIDDNHKPKASDNEMLEYLKIKASEVRGILINGA